MHSCVYLINLDGSDQRLSEATAQLNDAGIAFERVPAFDGRGLRPQDFPDYDAPAAIKYMGRPLRGGEVGCYLSHVACAEKFLTTGCNYCIVFEDDLVLEHGAWAILCEMLEELAKRQVEWDVINIGADRLKFTTTLSGVKTDELEVAVLRGHYFPMTTTGLIWSRDGATRFLTNCKPIFAPIDNFLREWQCIEDRGLAVSPPLVTTSGAASDIDAGSVKRQKENRSLFYGWLKQKRVWRNKLRALRHLLRRRRGGRDEHR